jgi:transcription elongation factor Elf1
MGARLSRLRRSHKKTVWGERQVKHDPKMKCPFCDHDLNLRKIPSYVDEEYELGCENCGAHGAIYRRKDN